DGPLQLGRAARGDRACPGQVVQAIGAELEGAAPPLVEPGLGAAHRPADVRDGAAGAAESHGTWSRREFVVHGCLRGAAAGGGPRRALEPMATTQALPEGRGTAGGAPPGSPQGWAGAAQDDTFHNHA